MQTSIHHSDPKPIDRISILLAKASSSKPQSPSQLCRKRWANLQPVFSTLVHQGFSGAAAVKWLIAEGEVMKDEEKKAFHALHQAASRNRRREAKKKEVARA